jgi:hypothetical protein
LPYLNTNIIQLLYTVHGFNKLIVQLFQVELEDDLETEAEKKARHVSLYIVHTSMLVVSLGSQLHANLQKKIKNIYLFSKSKDINVRRSGLRSL